MRAAALPPILLAAVALAPGGCGAAASDEADRFQGRQHDVAQTVDDLSEDARKQDARHICDALLTPALRDQIAKFARDSKRGTDCADGLRDSLRDADSFDLKVLGISVSGDRAVVRVETDTRRGRNPRDRLELVDQRGWRIARLP